MKPLLAPLLLLALAALPAAAADLALSPVVLQLDREHTRDALHVANRGAEPVLLQAEAIAWRREGGVDRDAPTGDVIVNPPVFTVQPGQTQIVRVGLRRHAAATQEATYRIVLREVPAPRDAADPRFSGSVRVLVALRVPLYVLPATVRRDERWALHRDAAGRLHAQVRNDGNVHLKVAALRLFEADAPRPAAAGQAVGAVVFPGEVRSFELAAEAPTTDRPLRLEVQTDRGAQYVALDPARP